MRIRLAFGILRATVNGVFLAITVYDLTIGPVTLLKLALAASLFFSTTGWWTWLTTKTSATLMLMHTLSFGPFCGLLPFAVFSSGDAFSFDTLPLSEFFPGVQFPSPTPEGLLLWDGQCGFCKRMLEVLQRIVRRPIAAKPFQEVLSELPEIVARQTGRQMHWVRPDRGIVGGSQALIEALRAGGRRWTAWLLATPLLRPITWAAYHIVASNRGVAGDAIGASCER